MILICDLKEEDCAIPIVISRIVGSDKWQITKEKDESIGRRGTRGFVITLNEKKEAIKKKKESRWKSRVEACRPIVLPRATIFVVQLYDACSRFAKRRKQSAFGLVLKAWTTKP